MVRDQIIRFLHELNFSAFRDLEVESADGVVTLRGMVQSFYHKQIVLTHSMRLVGQCKLVDELIVQNHELR